MMNAGVRGAPGPRVRAVGARVGQSSSAGSWAHTSGLRYVQRIHTGSRLRTAARLTACARVCDLVFGRKLCVRGKKMLGRDQSNVMVTSVAKLRAGSHQHWIELSRFSIISSRVYLVHRFFPGAFSSGTHTWAGIRW